MARTKIRQLEQISNSQVYNDGYAGATTQVVAEPTFHTQNIEYDLNILRTLMQGMKGAHLPDWYSATDGYTLSDLHDGYIALKTEIDLVEGSLGSMVDSTGAWFGFSGTNYIDSALTTTFALTELDAQVKIDHDGYVAAAAAAAAAQAELDAVEVAAGLNTNGTFLAHSGSNYIDSATTMFQVDSILDAQVKIAHDGYVAAAAAAAAAQAELDVVEASAGLNTNGTFLAHSGSNYIDTATTMFQVDSMLDAQVKIAHDGYVAAQAELDTLETALGTGINANGTYNNSPFVGSNYLDGYTSFTEDLLALDAAITAAASGATLQSAYNNGSPVDPDIQIDPNDSMNFRLGTGTSNFTVKANDGSPTFSVTNDEVKMYAGSGSPTVTVTDGYVLIDGYLSITGDTLQINTVVTDSDHWLIQPGLSSTVALEIMPSISAGLYTADLMQVYDGYNGTLVMNIDEAGTAKFNEQLWANGTFKYTDGSQTNGYFLTTDSLGNATWTDVSVPLAGAGLTAAAGTLNVGVVPNETIIDADRVGLAEAFIKTNYTSYQARVVNSDMILEATGTGNVVVNSDNAVTVTAAGAATINSVGASSWNNDTGNLTLQTTTSGNVNIQTAGVGDAIFMTTAGVGGGMTFSTNGTADSSNPSSVNIAQNGGFDTFGVNNKGGISLFQVADVYNSGGTPGQFPNVAIQTLWLSQTLDGNPPPTPMIVGFTINADDGYTQTTHVDGYHIVLSAQQADFGAGLTGGSLLMSGIDGYMQAYADARFSDARTAPTSAPPINGVQYFKLSSSTGGGADFSSGLRAAAATFNFLSAGSTGELGIIDAINTTFAAGGGSAASCEKAIYVIGGSDGRLSGGGMILSLNTTGGGPDRGSLELTPSGDGYGTDFRPGRDLEVWVNGTLMLPDATQKTSGTAATDDYYLASNDLDKINFAFALVVGDVVTIKNSRPHTGEDVDGGWTAVV